MSLARGIREEPPQQSSGERADYVAAELQAAGFGGASDAQRVSALLSTIRQFAEKGSAATWPPETTRKLWQSILGALRNSHNTEVQIAACAAVETLGQNCSSCTDLEREPTTTEEAVSCVVETISSSDNRQVLVAAVKALLSLSGCLNCRCYYDKPTQEVLGSRGAVEALLIVLVRVLGDRAEGGLDGHPHQDNSTAVVADIFRALHYTCLLNPANTARLIAAGGCARIHEGLDRAGKDLNVQEHGAMLLAEMAASPGPRHVHGQGQAAPGLGPQEVLVCVATVASIARLQLQDKYIEVARSAVWSLGRLASACLGASPTAAAAAASAEQQQQLQQEAWRLLSGQVLHVVVTMLMSCHLQDDPLVKHCLDYIAIIASAAPLHRAHSPAGADASSNSALSHESTSSDSEGVIPTMRLAAEAVVAAARSASEGRSQAVVLRTLHVLLLRFPGAVALQLQHYHRELLERALSFGSAARLQVEQQASQQHGHGHGAGQGTHGSAPQAHGSVSHGSKDLFLVQLYGLTVAGALSDAAVFGPDVRTALHSAVDTVLTPTAAALAGVSPGVNGGSTPFLNSVSVLHAHVLGCMAGIVRHLAEAGDGVSYDESAGPGARLGVGCCRYACHCCFIHDSVRGADVLAAVRAVASLLALGGGADGVNATDRDGCGVLHLLAVSGMAPLLAAYITAAGPSLDFLRRTRAGSNALQMARSRKHSAAVEMLELATETAAKAAQDALLKELEAEGAQESHAPGGGKRSGSASSTGTITGRSGAAAGGKGAAGGAEHAQHQQQQQPVAPDSEEARRARDELERKRRAAEEEYEAALELRRRQLEEEARQAAAEEARLIELAQQESLRLATPPPDAEQQQKQQERDSSGLRASDGGPEFEDQQAMTAAALAGLGDGEGGSLEASLQAAAAAMASGAPLPPSLAHILAQIAEQQQPQPQQPRQPVQVAQQQPMHAPVPVHAPAPVAVQSLAAPEAVRGGVSLSSLDEQVTMLPGGQSPGTAQGMQRVVSRQDLHASQHDAAASAAAAMGGGGVPGGSARYGAYGQPFTSSLMQQQQEQQQASVGLGFEAGNGGIRAPVPSRGGSDSLGSSFEGGLPPALQQQLQQQQQQQQASGGFQPGAWPGNQNSTYPSGPSGFLTNALGSTGSGGTGAPQQGGMLTSSSSNFLSQQAAQSDTWLSHQGQGQQQQQQQQLFGPGGAMALQGPGSGPEPPRGLQPSLHEALAAPQEQMWELAEEPTRGPSRQLWMGNVQGGLPPGHLQALCQQFGPVQDVVMAPGTLSAVVLFANAQDASRCAHALHGRDIPHMSYDNKPLVVRYCSTLSGSAAGEHTGGAAAAANAGAGADSASGLPPAIEAALAAAGFGPAAINAAMQGVLPPEQQQAFHAALLQASMAPPPAAAPPPPRVQQQPHALASRALGIGLDQLGGIGGSMPELAALHAVLAGGYSTGTDRPGPGGGGALFGGGGEGGVAASDADSAVGGSANGEGEGLGGAAGPGGGGDAGEVAADVPEGKPSRHLWLGNIPLKPNKLAMELLFARFGPLESVRVFPGKTFAFVNYLSPQHAVAAKMALDGQPAPSVTGSKPMVIRYQKDTSTVPANLGMAGGKSMSRSSSTNNLTGLSAAASLARLLDEDLPPEPAVNLSNKLNPNNIHYDRELAARYKRMSKAEKEALWAQDRAMQALGANAAAAAAAVNAGVPGGIAGLLDPTNAAAARLLAQAGLGGLAAGLSGGAGSEFLLPRVMSTGALDYLAASTGHAAHNAAAAAAVGGGHGGAGGGGHGGLFRVNTTQSLLGMQQAANAMLLPQMSGGLGGGLDANAVAAQALQQQLQAQQQALQQQLQQQALQQQLQQLTGAGGNHALLNNLAMSQALAGLGLGGPGAAAGAGPAGAAGLRGPGAPGVQAPGGGSSLDWASLQAALANLGLGGGAPGAAQAAATPQSAALAALLQQQQQQPPLSQAQQRLQQQQQFSALGGGPLAAAYGDGSGGGGAGGGGPGGPGAAGLSLHGPPVPPRRVSQTHSGRALNVGGPQPGMGGLNAAMMDPAAAAALAAAGGGLPGLGGGGGAGLVPPGAGGLGAPGGAAGRPAMPGPLGGGFKQLPPSFLCPLTRQLLSDPVVAADGITYNRPAIAEWLRNHDSSPVTRQPLANKMLTPNVALRNAIMAELGFGPQA